MLSLSLLANANRSVSPTLENHLFLLWMLFLSVVDELGMAQSCIKFRSSRSRMTKFFTKVISYVDFQTSSSWLADHVDNFASLWGELKNQRLLKYLDCHRCTQNCYFLKPQIRVGHKLFVQKGKCFHGEEKLLW